MDFASINLLILDVDGVLTSGEAIFCGSDSQTRVFSVLDGSAIKRWHDSGGRTAIISGRESEAVTERARMLGIGSVSQGVSDKLAIYERLLAEMNASDEQVCYIGDDGPDTAPMSRCAFPVAVANAAGAVKQCAQYVSQCPGGAGAVAEVIELLLRKQKKWAPLALNSA